VSSRQQQSKCTTGRAVLISPTDLNEAAKPPNPDCSRALGKAITWSGSGVRALFSQKKMHDFYPYAQKIHKWPQDSAWFFRLFG